MASDTQHCAQKQIRCADDFCRGRTPTVCANMYTATDFTPASTSRLQRKQYKFSEFKTGSPFPNKMLHCSGTRKYVHGFAF
jgi:hypothetical protein